MIPKKVVVAREKKDRVIPAEGVKGRELERYPSKVVFKSSRLRRMTPARTAGDLSLSMQGKGVIHEGFQVIAPSLHVLRYLILGIIEWLKVR